MQRKDLLTGEMFEGRVNQNFKSNANRIIFYNNIAASVRREKSKYDRPLHKNYLILKKILNQSKVCVFDIEYLRGAGFSFDVLTNIVDFNGSKCFALYNYILIIEPNNKIKIVYHG